MYYGYRLFGCPQSNSVPIYGTDNRRKDKNGICKETVFLPSLYDILDFTLLYVFSYIFIPRFHISRFSFDSERFPDKTNTLCHTGI